MRKKIIISLLFILMIFFFLIKVYRKQAGFYQKNIETFIENTNSLNYSWVFLDFFNNYFHYPLNKKELYGFIPGKGGYESYLYDPFSKKKNVFKYIPIFTKEVNKPLSYILVSTGIDGKIINIFPDTVYQTDISNFSFFNEPIVFDSMKFREFNLKFNLFDYYFGKKDLIVSYFSGIDIYKNNASTRLFTPKELMKKMSKSRLTKLDCCVIGKISSLDKKQAVLLDDEGNQINCKLFEQSAIENNNLDTIKIVGQYKNHIDIQNKIVYLENCIVLDY